MIRPSDLDERQGLTASTLSAVPGRNGVDQCAAHAVAPSGMRVFGVSLPTRVVAICAVALMIGIAFLLGFTITPPSKDPAPWDRISSVIGWMYFNAWAVSFLPQLYLNFVRGCVIGQSFDYVFLNVLGFFCYSIYTTCFYFVHSVQEDYKVRYGSDNTVDPNDVGFAVYAFLCCVYNSYQIYRYDRGDQTASKYILIGIATAVVVMLIWLIIVVSGVRTEYVFNTLDILYGLSVVKLGVSLIKYIPQVYLNYKRKCTVGWNIWNVLLDFTGGSLSVTQQLIDCGTTGRWNGIAGNPVKFCLGSLSMIYDVIFMIQHFWLYRENNARLHAEAMSAAMDADVLYSHHDVSGRKISMNTTSFRSVGDHEEVA
jgi:cystinosin